jgi:hypothetical protein
MRGLLLAFWARPFAALKAGCELLVPRMDGGQRVDGMVSRIVHTLTRAPEPGDDARPAPRAKRIERS